MIGKHIDENQVVEVLHNVCEFTKRIPEKELWDSGKVFSAKLSEYKVDSLDTVEFVMALEDKFEVRIDDNAMEKYYDMSIAEITMDINRLIEEQA